MNKLIPAIIILGLSFMVPGCKGKTEGEKALEEAALAQKKADARQKRTIGKLRKVDW